MMTLKYHNKQQLAILQQHKDNEAMGDPARVTCSKCPAEMRLFPKGKKAEDAPKLKALEKEAKEQGINAERVYCPECGFEGLKLTV